MLKLIIVLVVFAHGIGHILFLAPTLRLAAWGQTGESWVLAPIIGDGLARAVAGLLWAVVIALFVTAVAGLLLSTEWWRAAAVGAAMLSLAGIVVMWGGINESSAFFALAFNVIVLFALLFAHWPNAELAGS